MALDKKTDAVVWKGHDEIVTHSMPVVCGWSMPVCHDGHLYGIFCFKKFMTGPLKCVELATGKIKWEQRGFGQ